MSPDKFFLEALLEWAECTAKLDHFNLNLDDYIRYLHIRAGIQKELNKGMDLGKIKLALSAFDKVFFSKTIKLKQSLINSSSFSNDFEEKIYNIIPLYLSESSKESFKYVS